MVPPQRLIKISHLFSQDNTLVLLHLSAMNLFPAIFPLLFFPVFCLLSFIQFYCICFIIFSLLFLPSQASNFYSLLLLSSLFLLFYLVSTPVDLILSPFNYITSAGSFCFCFYTYLTSSPRFVSFQLMLYSLGHISLLFSSSFSLALLPFVYPLLLS